MTQIDEFLRLNVPQFFKNLLIISSITVNKQILTSAATSKQSRPLFDKCITNLCFHFKNQPTICHLKKKKKWFIFCSTHRRRLVASQKFVKIFIFIRLVVQNLIDVHFQVNLERCFFFRFLKNTL